MSAEKTAAPKIGGIPANRGAKHGLHEAPAPRQRRLPVSETTGALLTPRQRGIEGEKSVKSLFKHFGILAVIALLLNLAVLAGAVWVVVWMLRALGVIA